MELKILSACAQSRAFYDDIIPYLEEGDLCDDSKRILEKIEEYYHSDDLAEAVDVDLINAAITREWPKKAEYLHTITQYFGKESVPNVKKEVLALKKEKAGLSLSSALANNNQKDIDKYLEVYNEIRDVEDISELMEDKVEVVINKKATDLVTSYSSENLIKLFPMALNDRVDGGVPRQTNIIIFGLPESGKSMEAINLTYGFLKQGLKVLYCGNEDPVDAMILRFMSRHTGMTKYDIIADPDKTDALLEGTMYHNLVFAPLSPGTFKEIEALVTEHRPDILVLDQLRQIIIPGVDGEVEQITRASKRARMLVKKYNMVGIQVTQAADSASKKLVLEKGDVYMSNTSVPGDADILIGWGTTDEYEAQGRRMMSLCKNKISGDHGFFPVNVQPALSKVTS